MWGGERYLITAKHVVNSIRDDETVDISHNGNWLPVRGSRPAAVIRSRPCPIAIADPAPRRYGPQKDGEADDGNGQDTETGGL